MMDRAGASEADMSSATCFGPSRVGSVEIVTDRAGEAGGCSSEEVLVLSFATSRVGSVVMMDRAGASEADMSSVTSRVGFLMIVMDRASEAGRRSLVVSFAGSSNCLVPSESFVAVAEELQKKFKSCHLLYDMSQLKQYLLPLFLCDSRLTAGSSECAFKFFVTCSFAGPSVFSCFPGSPKLDAGRPSLPRAVFCSLQYSSSFVDYMKAR